MAVYKVIQDIEAEDKLLGPLTLKGFVYAAVAGVLAFLSVRLAISGIGDFKWAMIILMLPPIILFGLLAAPIGKDQPTEVWLLSHLQFFLKSKKRLWNQAGASHTVTITAPKKVEQHLTKEMSQTEVKSRLQALAATLDSRGWALKNADVNAAQPQYFQAVNSSSQRLVAPSSVDQSAPVLDVHAKDDIMDAESNITAQHFKDLMDKAEAKRKEGMLKNLEDARQQGLAVQKGTADLKNLPAKNAGPAAKTSTPTPVTPQQKLDAPQSDSRLLRSVFATGQATSDMMTDSYRADKMELAKSGNAFSVASLSKLANRHEPKVEQVGPNEVVINLH